MALCKRPSIHILVLVLAIPFAAFAIQKPAFRSQDPVLQEDIQGAHGHHSRKQAFHGDPLESSHGHWKEQAFPKEQHERPDTVEIRVDGAINTNTPVLPMEYFNKTSLFSAVKLVTVESRLQTSQFPLPGRPGAIVTNLGFQKKYVDGWLQRWLPFSGWLQRQGDPSKLVAFLDGGDVLYGGCDEKQFLRDYHKIVHASGGAPVVFSAEMGYYPPDRLFRNGGITSKRDYSKLDQRRQAVLKEFGLAGNQNWTSKNHLRFLNAGFLVGPISKVKELLDFTDHDKTRYLGKEGDHDQGAFAQYMVRHPEVVTLDYAGSLSLSIFQLDNRDMLGGITELEVQRENGVVYNKVRNQTQCFVHGNGASKKQWHAIASQLPVAPQF